MLLAFIAEECSVTPRCSWAASINTPKVAFRFLRACLLFSEGGQIVPPEKGFWQFRIHSCVAIPSQDETPAGQLCQKIADGDVEAKGCPTTALVAVIRNQEAFALLRRDPKLATEAIVLTVSTPTLFAALSLEADKDGMLPLHWAADRGDVDMVRPMQM